MQRVLVPYLIATVVALLVGVWSPTTPRMFVFRVVTGSGLGIYYFIPVLACCIVPLPLRFVLMSALGLAFGMLVVVAGRRGLGRRSRLLLGA